MKKYLIIIVLLFQLQAFSEEWKRVYLATYPRSGNHWMRYLIEEATHIATSSAYRDGTPPHLPQRFPWGGYCPDGGYEGMCRYPEEGDIVVIKTHARENDSTILPYQKIIRIVRHPVDSLYSEYVYLGGREDQIPREKLVAGINKWKKFEAFWNTKENVYTFRYEDLLDKPAAVLSDILKIIGYEVTDEDIQRAVSKHPPIGGLLKHLPHFSTSDLELISTSLEVELQKYRYEIPQG
ncbi:MAG: sulfotransferase domain-containing protein [Verrucomicrobia bacterium]|nr:sulfotransferase domain-containing protein [Verrucomicrobiota bacterium]